MKTILVTGAGNGIGRAIAHAANGAGYRVGLLDTDGFYNDGVDFVQDWRTIKALAESAEA